MAASPASTPLKRTPLYEVHVSASARIVPFAGYEMPVQYPLGVLKEHLWTREKAGLFDVSHMGQAQLVGPDHETTARALETLVPADILSLAPGQQRYSQFLNDSGGTIDDLMVTRPASPALANGTLMLVVNAGCKDKDYALLRARLPKGIKLDVLEDQALVALQGPEAAAVLGRIVRGTGDLNFMTGATFEWRPGVKVHVSRSGYTGEDGFEISVHRNQAAALWAALTVDERVKPIGLGARDSLRLEAGLCLYGHELDETVSPIEANIAWSIQKRRRSEGGFPGAARIQRELADGPSRLRIGIRPDGRAPAREGTEIRSAAGEPVGTITSGGYGPTVNGPIAMGYVARGHSAPGTPLQLIVRGQPLAARVVPLPFAPHRYRKG
jgi:aminomethyltransferase